MVATALPASEAYARAATAPPGWRLTALGVAGPVSNGTALDAHQVRVNVNGVASGGIAVARCSAAFAGLLWTWKNLVLHGRRYTLSFFLIANGPGRYPIARARTQLEFEPSGDSADGFTGGVGIGTTARNHGAIVLLTGDRGVTYDVTISGQLGTVRLRGVFPCG